MSDALFYLIVALVAGMYLWRSYRRRKELLARLPDAARGARVGPVPGYSRLPGKNVQWTPDEPQPPGLGKTWEPVCMETIHAGKRSRLVLSLRRIAEMAPTDQFSVMKTLAQRLVRRTGALVVAVQFESLSSYAEPEAVLIFARDGRGWTGTTTDAALTAHLPGREDFRLAS